MSYTPDTIDSLGAKFQRATMLYSDRNPECLQSAVHPLSPRYSHVELV
jgi:hypothetical protein